MSDQRTLMFFTTDEWRMIAVACVKVRPSAFIKDGDAAKQHLAAIAARIAAHTGKVE